MITRTTKVLNKSGIHARPASAFVNEAKQFKSQITIRNLNRSSMKGVNAKSMIMVLTLEASKGTEIEISADGPDEKEAVDTLIALVDNGINECVTD